MLPGLLLLQIVDKNIKSSFYAQNLTTDICLLSTQK